MKDFDQERRERHAAREEALGDRTFQFGGELFSYRANVRFGVLQEVSEISNSSTGNTVIGTLANAAVNLIEGGEEDRERFLRICERDEDAITFQDLDALVTWLIEEQVKSPTPASSPSTAGDATTTTDLKENSSSPPAAASAA